MIKHSIPPKKISPINITLTDIVMFAIAVIAR